MLKSDLTYTIRKKAFELGFHLFGVCNSEKLLDEAINLSGWLSSGFAADMEWIEKTKSKRINPAEIFPEAKSVICLGMNYFSSLDYKKSKEFGKISRYALNKDYHNVIKSKIELLKDFIIELDKKSNIKYFIDSGPVLEKAFSQKAGLGWIGKNTNLINKKYGSWFFLAVIFFNLELEFNNPVGNFCGSCKKCIEACPTKALVEPYILDSRKCISYLTIENKGDELPIEFSGQMENWIFGCDICQEVCPWNKFAVDTSIPEFIPQIDHSPMLKSVLEMNETEFKSIFKESPIKRSKYSGLIRNVNFILKEQNK